DPATGALLNPGGGPTSSYVVAPALVQVLHATAAQSPAAVRGTLTDGLTHTTAYGLDSLGRETSETAADTGTQTWERNDAGQVTRYTDALQRVTQYAYDDSAAGKGDLLQVSRPNGGWTTYRYDPSFHHVTLETTAVENNGQTTVTVSSYDAVT